MNSVEFTYQLDRLAAGLNEKMTDERADALYQAMKHHFQADWKRCVDRCLCQHRRFPSLDQMLAELDKVKAADRQASGRARDTIFQVDPEDMTEAYGRFRIRLIQRMLDKRNGLTPPMVAGELREAAERFPDHRAAMLAEADQLSGKERWL